MRGSTRSRLVLLALVLGTLSIGSASGSRPAVRPTAAAAAIAVKIIVPGQSPIVSAAVSAPANANGYGSGFSYPADGSIVTTGAVTSSAAADSTSSTASAGAQVTDLSLFGGEVTVARVNANVVASGTSDGATGEFNGTGVTGIGGSEVVGNSLGSWGRLTLGSGNGRPVDTPQWHAWAGGVVALDVKLISAHGGLPAGSEIIVGSAAARVQVRAFPQLAQRTAASLPQKPTVGSLLPRLPVGRIAPVELTAAHYVFPVYGAAFYTDTFGAPRADVGWHHGDDIFAPIGAPVLAVADGTVFSVGWNHLGGWRLWLRDTQGNTFYYAHLSAFSPFAVDNAQVRAGTVLGFVGKTGDAEHTPSHLHFEVHPVMLLPLGYDGAVDPTPYLDAWRRLQDITFSTDGEWLPALLHKRAGHAPEAGAILLRMTDISSASGLDPASLQRALRG